jgi:hypothetical protein
MNMTDKNDSDYKVQKRIETAWKDSLSEWALRSVDHYHRTIQDREVSGA